jgi:hypothetical protein
VIYFGGRMISMDYEQIAKRTLTEELKNKVEEASQLTLRLEQLVNINKAKLKLLEDAGTSSPETYTDVQEGAEDALFLYSELFKESVERTRDICGLMERLVDSNESMPQACEL